MAKKEITVREIKDYLNKEVEHWYNYLNGTDRVYYLMFTYDNETECIATRQSYSYNIARAWLSGINFGCEYSGRFTLALVKCQYEEVEQIEIL